MKLIEIKDEFEDKDPNDLQHLWRIQAARCHEFSVWQERLFGRPEFADDDIQDIVDVADIKHMPHRWMRPFNSYVKGLQSSPAAELNPQLVDRCIEAYQRMITAKRAFEHAGGDYGHYAP